MIRWEEYLGKRRRENIEKLRGEIFVGFESLEGKRRIRRKVRE